MSLDVFSYMWIIPMKLDVNPGNPGVKHSEGASAGFSFSTQKSSFLVLSGNFHEFSSSPLLLLAEK